MPNCKHVYAFVTYYESSPKKENCDGTYLLACPDKTTLKPRPPAIDPKPHNITSLHRLTNRVNLAHKSKRHVRDTN